MSARPARVSSEKRKRSTIWRRSWSSLTRTISSCACLYPCPSTDSRPPLTSTYLLILCNAHRYKVGEAFVHMPHARAMERLEKDQDTLTQETARLVGAVEECETGMKALKVTLYAKFGSAINLDE